VTEPVFIVTEYGFVVVVLSQRAGVRVPRSASFLDGSVILDRPLGRVVVIIDYVEVAIVTPHAEYIGVAVDVEVIITHIYGSIPPVVIVSVGAYQ
jgi:hypothetical protein